MTARNIRQSLLIFQESSRHAILLGHHLNIKQELLDSVFDTAVPPTYLFIAIDRSTEVCVSLS